MYASFAQYVGAVVLDEEAIAKSLLDSQANATAALQNKKTTKKLPTTVVSKNDMSSSEAILGKLLVMGNVTKKLVITPDYPIGEGRGERVIFTILFFTLLFSCCFALTFLIEIICKLLIC